MLESIVRNWWVFALRGVLAIAFGVLAFIRPEITLAALVALFGIYALLDGIFSFSAAFTLAGSRYFGWLLLEGLLGIAVGVLTFIYPHTAALSLLYLLGAWLIFDGILRIVAAVELRKLIEDEWVYLLGGIVSVAAGVLTMYRPNPSALAWMWVIGVYAVLYGILMLALGFKLHKLESDINSNKTVAQG